MNYIKRYIECNLSPEICSLNCAYCYLMQENRKNKGIKAINISPSYVALALSPERMGGICFVSLSVAGETMHSDFIIDVAKELLHIGHFVNITTNGTLLSQYDKILMNDADSNRRLLFTFSFHYIELKKKKLLSVFWKSVKKVKNAGCSICVKLNLCDEYIPYLDEIKNNCLHELGVLPQMELTRKERGHFYTLFSKYDLNNYKNFVEIIDSNLFRFTCDNFRRKRKQFFCYAGDWTMVLDLATGNAKGCYEDYRTQNIYKNIKKPIDFSPIGNNCRGYCHNGQHFLAWGAIPEIHQYSYGGLRDREEAHWQTLEFKEFGNHFLFEQNKEYSSIRKKYYNIRYRVGEYLYKKAGKFI